MTQTLVPVSRHESIYGTQFVYEAAEHALIIAGLIPPADLPKANPRCRTEIRCDAPRFFQSAYRMKDGRVRLQVSASKVLRQDSIVTDFMARTVGLAVINLALGVLKA